MMLQKFDMWSCNSQNVAKFAAIIAENCSNCELLLLFREYGCSAPQKTYIHQVWAKSMDAKWFAAKYASQLCLLKNAATNATATMSCYGPLRI